jgi:hypothetical protein
MVGLVPTIHVFLRRAHAEDVDARHKGEHDVEGDARVEPEHDKRRYRPTNPSQSGRLTSALRKITP